MRDLTEDEVLGAIQSSASLEGRIKLTYESGPYDIDRPTNVAMIFAAAVQRKFREVNGIDGVQALDQRQVREDSQGLGEPGRLSPSDGVSVPDARTTPPHTPMEGE